MDATTDGTPMSIVFDTPPSSNKRKIIMESAEIKGASVGDKKIKMEGTDDSPSPQQMKIFAKVVMTLPMIVNTSDTIEDVKAKYCPKVGMDNNTWTDEDFFFGGDQLKNGVKLIDYGVHDGSTVHVILQAPTRMKINIKTNCVRNFTLGVHKWDTIKKIKSMIRDVMTLQNSQQLDLAYDGKRLDDDFQPLAYYNVLSESILYAMFSNDDRFEVKVITLLYGVINIEVKLSYTIGDLKLIIESMLAIPTDDQKLFKREELLEDYKTVAEYKFMKGTEIHLMDDPDQDDYEYEDAMP